MQSTSVDLLAPLGPMSSHKGSLGNLQAYSVDRLDSAESTGQSLDFKRRRHRRHLRWRVDHAHVGVTRVAWVLVEGSNSGTASEERSPPSTGICGNRRFVPRPRRRGCPAGATTETPKSNDPIRIA